MPKKSVDKLVDLLRAMEPAKPVDSGKGNDIEAAKQTVAAPVVDPFIGQIPSLQKDAFLKIGVAKECVGEEKRVAIVPAAAKRLLKNGMQVLVQSGAGKFGGFSDSAYEDVGAKILTSTQSIYDSADVIIKIKEPAINGETRKHEIDMVPKGKTLVAFVGPRTDNGKALMDKAAAAGINLLAVDAIPRISRAQSLDVLSSQAKIAGYRAVVEAANIYQRFLNGEVTAAGKFDACKIMVVGAGVAGLAAIGTGANMGAIVRAFDTRLETKDQVESMGGEFLVLNFDDEDGGDASGYAKTMSPEFYAKEMDMFREQAKECNIIITTAAIPGRPAPKLIMKDAVDNLQPGSVIVDLAGATGGNCELTRPGETYVYDNRVTIIGSTDLIGRMSWQASSMYSNNMANLMDLLCPKPAKGSDKPRALDINMEDKVIRGMTVVNEGNITWPPPADVTATAAAPKSSVTTGTAEKEVEKKPSIFSKRVLDLTTVGELATLAVVIIFFVCVALYAHITFISQMLYFILAGILGYYLIWSVEPALFSPLMSTSNSLSGVVILGGMLMASLPQGSAANVLGAIAISVAAINVFGGFAVSYRMLLMFKAEK